MANTDAPFGFKPLRHMFGGPIHTTKYVIASNESSDIGIGDPVVRNGTASSTGLNAGLPIVTLATAGAGGGTARVTGIVESFEPYRPNLGLHWYDASEISVERVVNVIDDPYVIFLCQDDGTATLAITDVGQNIDIALDSGVDTATGVSGAELDASNVTSDATYQCTLMRLHKDGGDTNEVGQYAIWEVRICNHTEAPNTAGV